MHRISLAGRRGRAEARGQETRPGTVEGPQIHDDGVNAAPARTKEAT